MTKEEAIRCLSVHSSTNGSGLCTDEQHYEAKQMAIKALEQEPIFDKIRAEIKQLPYQSIFGKVSSYSLIDAVVEIIDKYKTESER